MGERCRTLLPPHQAKIHFFGLLVNSLSLCETWAKDSFFHPELARPRLLNYSMKGVFAFRDILMSKAQPGPRPLRKPSTRLVLSLAALALVAFPCWIVWKDLKQWDKALPASGKVVRTSPEGPFPDVLTIAYQDQSSQPHQVDIPTPYTTVRQVGDQVDLEYLPDAPSKAMTRIQRRDEGWSVSPYLLFGCLGAATLFLHFAFPEYISLRKKGSR